MKHLLSLLLILFTLSSCQILEKKDIISPEEQQKIADEKKQALEIQEKRLLIKEKKRQQQRELDRETAEKEKELHDKLLSNGLLQEVQLNNKGAQEILKKELKELLPVSDVKFDLDTDSSVTKFVSNKVSFTELTYVPKNLQKLSGEYLLDAKGSTQLRKTAFKELERLSQDFFLKFGVPLKVVSGYRSYEYQKRIKDNGCPDSLCANAGYSEHQSGLAIDLWEASDYDTFMKSEKNAEYYRWAIDVAHNYGLINPYQDGIEADGYEIEPWHWRYVGTDLAKFLKEYDFSFKEYYDLVQNQSE